MSHDYRDIMVCVQRRLEPGERSRDSGLCVAHTKHFWYVN